MTVYAAPIEVCNAALLHVGALPATNLTDNSAEIRILNGVYEGKVKEMLTKHAWTWAEKTEKIIDSGTSPDDGQYMYPLPADYLSLRMVRVNGCPTHIRRLEGRNVFLASKSDNVYATYTWRVPESIWPADFAEAVVTRLYAQLQRSLLNEADRGDRSDLKAQMLMRQAMVRDKNQIKGPGQNRDAHMARARRGVFDR